MIFTESNLKTYSAPLSESENRKCINAIEMVRDALKTLDYTDDGKSIGKLFENTYAYTLEMRGANDGRKIKIFVQGSYANNTNVRTESDVDIAVVQEDVFQTAYRSASSPFPQSDDDYKFTVVPGPNTFKDDVHNCLKTKFGRDVERGDKSIKIHGNTYRKDADAVPCQRYRDYRGDYRKDEKNYVPGIIIRPDSGGRIINYPEQHIENGKKKNGSTNLYYKKMVRIIKKVRYLMIDHGYASAQKVSSFGLESLLWNLPDYIFMKESKLTYIFDGIIDYLKKNKNQISTYKEANGIKLLCSTKDEIINYENFIDDIYDFYEFI